MIETTKDNRYRLHINGRAEDTYDTREEAEAEANRQITARLHRHYYTAHILRYLCDEGHPAAGSRCGDELIWDAVADLARRCEEEAWMLAIEASPICLHGEPGRFPNGAPSVDALVVDKEVASDAIAVHKGEIDPAEFGSVQQYAGDLRDAARDRARQMTGKAVAK